MSEARSQPAESKNLLIAVVQSQDAEIARDALAKLGIMVERLPSTGGFLGRRNATLLVGLPEARREEAQEVLHDNCRQRVEFIAVPLESAPLPLPTPTPITVGGATVFALEVEYYEEI
ncbi:MAG: cyclic-di-AMP receptor [Anaerolineae bacterium]|nr:cyclic-di-AMP receptor [Anaerolineae bacterium]